MSRKKLCRTALPVRPPRKPRPPKQRAASSEPTDAVVQPPQRLPRSVWRQPLLAVRYLLALYRWVRAGRPTRTQKEIDALLVICQQNKCGKYAVDRKGEGYCRECGCCANNAKNTFTNKLAMRSERCPKELW